MAARRNKRGRRRNRGRFGFLYKLLSAVMILAAIVVGCVVFFRVNTIEVEGAGKYSAQQIIEAAGVEQGDNLFALNKFDMSKQILIRLPYVDEVAISRRLPDALVIRVTECVPMAVIQGDGAWWVLDARGKILERTDFAGSTAYPEVVGLTPAAPTVGMKLSVAEEQQVKLNSLNALLRAVASRGMTAQVQRYDLTAVNRVEMNYTDRFTVRIPMSMDDERAMRAMRTVLAAVEKLPETATGILDLTVSQEEVHLIPYPNQ